MKPQVFRQSRNCAYYHLSSRLCKKKKNLYNFKEDGVLFIFKSSFFTGLSHAFDSPEWEINISYASDWNSLQGSVALRSIYLNTGIESHQGLQSDALLFLSVRSKRLHFIFFFHMWMCDVHVYSIHMSCVWCTCVQMWSKGGLRLTPVSPVIAPHCIYWCRVFGWTQIYWFWLV